MSNHHFETGTWACDVCYLLRKVIIVKKIKNKLRVQVRDVLGVYMDVARHGGLYWESSLAPLTLKCLNQLFSETLWINKRVEENLGTLFCLCLLCHWFGSEKRQGRILHTRKWWFRKCKGPSTLGQANANERRKKKQIFPVNTEREANMQVKFAKLKSQYCSWERRRVSSTRRTRSSNFT